MCFVLVFLFSPGFAGAEDVSHVSQVVLYLLYKRVRATEDAPRDPIRVLEGIHGLAQIVERGGRVIVERPRVNTPQPERIFITLAGNASRRGYRFAQQRLGFSEALETNKGICVVEGCSEGMFMFLVESQ